MFRAIDRAPTGHYEIAGGDDSGRRFVNYRALPDSADRRRLDALDRPSPAERRAAEYRLSAAIFALFVAIFCIVLIRSERRTQRNNTSLTTELIERRRAEAALGESQGLFAGFLDHIPAVVFVQDLQGGILYSNQAYKHLPGREAIGRNARELLAPGSDDQPREPARAARALDRP